MTAPADPWVRRGGLRRTTRIRRSKHDFGPKSLLSGQVAGPLPASTSARFPLLLCSVHSGYSAGRNHGHGRAGRREDGDEWLPVLRPAYAAARDRHARIRADAYAIARVDALQQGLCGPELWFGDIDRHALAVWKQTWTGVHPSGAGNWRWPSLVENLPHRAAVLPIAIWYGDDLCGLALGHASRHRLSRSRHTVTLTHLERRPAPPAVPLRGHVANLAFGVAKQYAEAVGSRRIRLLNPDRNLLAYYEELGFNVVWKDGIPLFCERELFP